MLPSGQGSNLGLFWDGIIVPRDVPQRWSLKLNFHAAPASYPGRDPHHWAAYDQSNSYGATLHDMTSKVDVGTIRAQILFGVKPCLMPIFILNSGRWLYAVYLNFGLGTRQFF